MSRAMAINIRAYAVPLAWLRAAAGLWTVALVVGSNQVGFISLLTGGIGLATLFHTRRQLLGPGTSGEKLRGEVEDLESPLADAELDNARLRAEADFDRQLRSGTDSQESQVRQRGAS